MKAHTTTRLVDPRAVETRKKYRNVDEYESARTDAMSRPATEEELQWQKHRAMQSERTEEERRRRLKERDDRAAIHHDAVSRLMLGGR
jgi:hypothetical protein